MNPTASISQSVTVQNILQAKERLAGVVLRTPLVFSPALSKRTGCQIYLKMECWQLCGCFKVRGAINKISVLSEEEAAAGLVTASSGNHGIAVAFAAQQKHLSARVFLPEGADASRVEKIHLNGGETVFFGKNFAEAYDEAQLYARQSGAAFVHSHADPLVIAGQGTIGLEILEDLPQVDAIIAPIGGGGLISGISMGVKSIVPGVRIFGAEPSAAPSAFRSIKEGVCYERIDVLPSIADGLLGGVGKLPFEIFRDRLESVALIDDSEMVEAMKAYQQDEQLMVEAAAAVPLAAILSRKIELQGRRVVLVVTSRNIDAERYSQILLSSERKTAL